MAKKQYPTPNMGNMSLGALVDILGDYREKEKEAKFYNGFYTEVIKAKLVATEENPEGESYVAELKTTYPERFDVTACRAAAEAGDEVAKQALAKWCKTTTQTALYINERAKPVLKVKNAVPK